MCVYREIERRPISFSTHSFCFAPLLLIRRCSSSGPSIIPFCSSIFPSGSYYTILTHTFSLHLSLHLFIFPSILRLFRSCVFFIRLSLSSQQQQLLLPSNILSSVFAGALISLSSPFCSGPHSPDVIATCIFYAGERERDSKLSVYERKGCERE